MSQHEGLLEADVLVASGNIITIDATGQYKDLFEAFPNSLVCSLLRSGIASSFCRLGCLSSTI